MTEVVCCVCSVAQLCPTLCDPMDCSPPGSSAHGILQARLLEGVAISFSRGPSRRKFFVSGVYCTGRWILYNLYHLVSLKFACAVEGEGEDLRWSVGTFQEATHK